MIKIYKKCIHFFRKRIYMSKEKLKPSRLTKEIKDAVKRLLVTKRDISRITISAIAKEANISRGTFYNHYNNANDIINEIEEDMLVQFNRTWKKAERSDYFAETLMKNITTSIRRHEREYLELGKYLPQQTFVDLKSKIMKQITSTYIQNNSIDQEDRAALFILANGIAGCYIDYIQSKAKVDLDELSKTSIRLIKNMLYQKE